AGAVVDPNHPSDAYKALYRHHAGNDTVAICTEMRTKLEAVEVRTKISRAVKRMLLRLSRPAMDLKTALKMACGQVAKILLGEEELPPQVSPFFLDASFDQPERDGSYALVGFMCPAHEDNVCFSGESLNRTTTLHRLIESALVSQGHDQALCVNTNAVRCLKSGDGSYSNPCAVDENVNSVSQLLRAMYFAGLRAYGVKISRIVQCCGSEELERGPFHLGPWSGLLPAAGLLLSLSTTQFLTAPHLTATKCSQSYHEGLAARVAAQIVQARLGEKGPRLSSTGRAVFGSVRAGTNEAAFRECPEDIGPPAPSSGSAASEQAVTNLRSMLEESLCGSLGSREVAASAVSRISAPPSKDEAKQSATAAKNANDAAFKKLVSDRDGVKNSGVAGGLTSGVAIVDTWTPDACDSGRLIERGPGTRDQRVAHTWHMNSLLLGRAHGGASAPRREATCPSRTDLLDDKQARRRLGEPPLLLNRQGVTDGGGKEQTGYRMPSKDAEAVGRAVCKEALIAAVSKGGVRVVVSNNGAREVGTPDQLLDMLREDGWGDKEVTADCRRFFLDQYGCSFGMGDTVGSAASAHIIYRRDRAAGSSFLLYSTGGQASYLASAEMGLLKMGQVAGVSGAGEDAIFAHFLGRFCGVELLLAALASSDGQSANFAESFHGALYAHGALGVVRSLKSSAG
ncbi:unnamed protein product, partial [Ectocarpus sp. 4 AP-2014]